MIPKFRAWSRLSSRMYVVNGLYFDRGMVQYANNDNAIRLIKLENIILMQSTGLKDKNGKEIFEGDILGTKDGLLNGVVEYRADLGMFVNSLIRYNNFERLCNVADNREILGNIYENPELLELEVE